MEITLPRVARQELPWEQATNLKVLPCKGYGLSSSKPVALSRSVQSALEEVTNQYCFTP